LGAQTPIGPLSWRFTRPCRGSVTPPLTVSEATWMLSKLAYLTLCRSIQLLVLLARTDAAKDLEILVLRHQLTVLRRQVARPRLQPADRALLACVSRVLPHSRWWCFFVQPETLLRWHRRLVAGTWTYPNRGPGRPQLHQEIQQLIIRWPRRTRAGATSASKASCCASACGSRQPGSAPRCAAMGLTRHHDEGPRPGVRSCVSRPLGSSPATTSPSTRCGSSSSAGSPPATISARSTTWPGSPWPPP
jgi:hypothetical protein